ncbi:MAG: c-type cytochrome [Nitrospinae bacterium]|nr:c-type cytochrome [Nitrospinota bacterium]
MLLTGLLFPAPSPAIESRKIEKMIEASQSSGEGEALVREKQDLLNQGKTYYYRFCVPCHGKEGKGRGEASLYIFPKPRDLSSGIFKFHSTRTNTLPLNEDLFRTIHKGIPGSPMPAWGETLSDEVIGSLVEFIKTFSRRFSMEVPDHKMPISLEPPFDELSVADGKKLYKQLRCGRCHGEEGTKEGKLVGVVKYFGGNPFFVYDLRRANLYKSGSTGTDIYRTFMTGLDGSPMNAYDYLSNSERWNLIHFLQSRFFPQKKEPVPGTNKILSKQIQSLIDVKPDSSIWKGVAAYRVNLSPVQARKNPISFLTVQSVHNQNKIAFRMQWEDPTPDGALNSIFLDQSAIQFALGQENVLEGPFFGMGEKDKPVNIWHWQADAHQKIIRGDEPESNRSSKAPPQKTGLFVNPFNESPVEEMNSRGFGTLTVQSLEDQQVEGKGQWEGGRWSVVFVRELKTSSRWDVSFADKGQALLAFALWDGDNKDKSANKMVSFWQVLRLQ